MYKSFLPLLATLLLLNLLQPTSSYLPTLTRRKLLITPLPILPIFLPTPPTSAITNPPTSPPIPTTTRIKIKRSCDALRSSPPPPSAAEFSPAVSTDLRSNLRAPPFDTLRKTMQGAYNIDEGLREPYKTFIKDVERYDNALGRVGKGEKLKDYKYEIYDKWEKASKSCDGFYNDMNSE